jgi:hypothetical protein
MVADENACVVCGGDRFISNSAGGRATCSGCGGSGVRGREAGLGMKDVTKTKPQRTNGLNGRPVRPTHALSLEGIELEKIITGATISSQKKAELLKSIIDFEVERGRLTETFSKKVRKQLRALGAIK